jgi:sphingomyelin phosphodiesterase 2
LLQNSLVVENARGRIQERDARAPRHARALEAPRLTSPVLLFQIHLPTPFVAFNIHALKIMTDTLRVISLNCWGLKFISKAHRERLSQIGSELASADPVPEIVGLQECWTQEDYNAIRERSRHILPYGKFYWSGVFGGGLAILSKWPILESSMNPYKLNGRPTAFFRGDWYVGKGVACAKIRMDDGKIVEVFCTHVRCLWLSNIHRYTPSLLPSLLLTPGLQLHAPYEREPNDSYLCHRTAQAWQISSLMRSAYEKGHLVLGLGDFNMIPLSLAHHVVSTHGRAHDTWRLLHPDSSIGAHEDSAEKTRGRPMPSANFNLEENGTTCDSILNTWRWNKGQQQALWKGKDVYVNPDDDDVRGKRLDYIFLGDASGEWTVKSANVGMLMRHPTLKCSLSDHFSVEATLVRRMATVSAGINDMGRKGDSSLPIPTPPPEYLPPDIYESILAMADKYMLRERSQRRWRMGHFIASVVISIGCLVAVWWSPHNYVAFILMLVSTLNLSAGVIDGLIGGLFMSWEIRNLKEFQWDIQNAKELATRGKS